MGLIVNNESFSTNASGVLVTQYTSIFKDNMDSLLIGGWDFTIDLPAHKTDCPSPACKYNPTYERYVDVNGGPCRACTGRGFILEPRWTVYKCNRRWTNEPFDQSENTGEKTIGGRVLGNFIRVKTVAAALDHIKQSIGGQIDGVKVKLYKEPRLTGWGGSNLYVVSWWEVMNKSG